MESGQTSAIDPEEHRVLTVEYDAAGGEVAICLDAEGLRALRRALDRLEGQVAPTHTHLMTPAWGGHELNETPVGNSTALIHHLRLVRLGD